MDKIGDLLNRFATVNPNAKDLTLNHSKYKLAILKVLYEEGWIAGVTCVSSVSGSTTGDAAPPGLSGSTPPGKGQLQKPFRGKVASRAIQNLKIFLKRPYIDASACVSRDSGLSKSGSQGINLKSLRISKPGRRVYCSSKELEKLMLKESTAANTFVVSTNKGVMTLSKAVDLNLGGELLFKLSI